MSRSKRWRRSAAPRPAPRPAPRWGLLQRFAAEDEGRTEDPTSKKLGKARSEGNVAKSPEIAQVAGLFFGFLLVYLIHNWMIRRSMDHMHAFLGNLHLLRLTDENLSWILRENVRQFFLLASPFLLLAAVVGVASFLLQFGYVFSWKPLKPNFNKFFNPQQIVSRFFGKEMLFQLGKSAGKVFFLSLVALLVLYGERETLYFLLDMPAGKAAENVIVIAWKVVMWLSVFLAAFAAADYAYMRHKWWDSLKMSKFEVKDERRQAEGDPEVKKAQRKRMMEAMRRRMLKEVPEADVVVTNPTHYAVALKYEAGAMDAPVVVAKGEGLLARRIREIAEEHDVPIYEDPPLAHALYRAVEVGDPIPEDLFGAVAEVLAFVYRRKGRRFAGAGAN